MESDFRPFASHYKGAAPSSLLLFGLPSDLAAPTELTFIFSLMSSATTVKWEIADWHISRSHPFFTGLAWMPPRINFHQLHEFLLSFSSPHGSFTPLFMERAEFFEAAPNLQKLWLCGLSNLVPVLNCIRPILINLKHLVIFRSAELLSDLDFRQSIALFTQLETLTFLSDMAEQYRTSQLLREDPFDQSAAEEPWASMSRCLPPQLADLRNVSVINDLNLPSQSLFSDAFLLASEQSTPAAKCFLLERIKAAGINHAAHDRVLPPLAHLLAYAKYYDLPLFEKARALLDAGADCFQTVPLRRGDVYWSTANALHCAHLEVESARLLYQRIVDWGAMRKENWAKLRSSDGFTPLHEVSKFNTWLVHYEEISVHYPDVLSDTYNAFGMTPLEAIHSRRTRGFSSDDIGDEVAQTLDFILDRAPVLSSSGLVRLFALMLSFYGSRLRHLSPARVLKIRDVFSMLLPRCDTLNRSGNGNLLRYYLDFDSGTWNLNSQVRLLIAAMSFAEGLIPAVFDGCKPRVLSAALSQAAVDRARLPNFSEKVVLLVKSGAEINRTSGTFQDKYSFLQKFVVSYQETEYERNNGGLHVPHTASPDQEFWRDFFHFCELGADLELDNKPISIHHEWEWSRLSFGSPFSRTWECHSPNLARFILWIVGREERMKIADPWPAIFQLICAHDQIIEYLAELEKSHPDLAAALAAKIAPASQSPARLVVSR